MTEVVLPPRVRSRATLGLTAAAAVGRFELQVCRACGAVQYPPREACHRCLSSLLDWKLQDGSGELISETTLWHSHDEFFRARVPIRLGLVRLASGPTAVVYLHSGVPPAPVRVKVDVRLDKAGQGVLVAFSADGLVTAAGDSHVTESKQRAEDRHLREMTCDPRGRKVLVTSAGTALGGVLVQGLVDAGAEVVWAGYGAGAAAGVGAVGGALELTGPRDLAGRFKQVRLLALDVTSDVSVNEAAAAIASQVDIVINNAEVHAGAGARAEMDTHYFGLLRLAQALGPAMRARAATPDATVSAWVNVLSIYALCSFPTLGTLSASLAAAHSLSQSLRAEMLVAGIRVINVFPGPMDDERHRSVPLAKIAPAALARAVVKALQDGVEDVYPGDVAQEWFARWRENPKVLERELSTGR